MDPSNAAIYANIPIFSALIFWSFIAIVSVAGMFKEFANKREVQRTLRAAIERNQPLDPAVVEKIVATSAVQPERFAIAGTIVVAAGHRVCCRSATSSASLRGKRSIRSSVRAA